MPTPGGAGFGISLLDDDEHVADLEGLDGPSVQHEVLLELEELGSLPLGSKALNGYGDRSLRAVRILLDALARTGALAQVQRRLDLPAKGGSHAAGNA